MSSAAENQYARIPAAAVWDADLSRTELRVLLAVAAFANPKGVSRVAQATIAKRLGCSRQNVASALKRIERKGFLSIEVLTAPGRGKIGCVYRIGAPPMSSIQDIGSHVPMSPVQDTGPMSSNQDTGGPTSSPQDIGPMSSIQDTGHRRRAKPQGGVPMSSIQDTEPMSSIQDILQRESPSLRSGDSVEVVVEARAAAPAPAADWKARLGEARERAAGVLNEASPGVHHFRDLRALVDQGCDWELDVLPAIDGLVGAFRAKGALLRGWTLVRDYALRNRDQRKAEQARPMRLVDFDEAYTPQMAGYAASKGYLNGHGEALHHAWRDRMLSAGTLVADVEASFREWVDGQIVIEGADHGNRAHTPATRGRRRTAADEATAGSRREPRSNADVLAALAARARDAGL